MPLSAAAAFSCDPSTEVYVGGNTTGSYFDGGTSCNKCPGDIQTACSWKGRTVSKFECNWWDGDLVSYRTTVCVGCCGAPHPPLLPVVTNKCQDRDADPSFTVGASRPWDCGKCQKGCEDKCARRGETVSREMCVFNKNNYDCKCCCRPAPPPPPPSAPVRICAAGQTSVSSPITDCRLCNKDYCGTKCPGGPTSARKSACGGTPETCECCCDSNTLPSSATALGSSVFAQVQ